MLVLSYWDDQTAIGPGFPSDGLLTPTAPGFYYQELPLEMRTMSAPAGNNCHVLSMGTLITTLIVRKNL